MSPEQARGKTVDKRTDIWAFGAVLFEMLAGRRAFAGDDASEVLASVLAKEPDWARLPATLSPALGTYIRRCLHKDPRQRIHDIGDVRLALEGAFETAAPQTAASSAAPRRRTVAIASAALFVGAAVAALATWALTRPAPVTLQPMRFALVPPAAQALSLTAYTRHVVLSDAFRFGQPRPLAPGLPRGCSTRGTTLARAVATTTSPRTASGS